MVPAQAGPLQNGSDSLSDARYQEAEEILRLVQKAVDELKLSGRVCFFGSFATGFWTKKSDCDIAYISENEDGESRESPITVLQQLACTLPKYGFHSVVTVFQASIPVLKLNMDGTEVDISIGNRLGSFNSQLMATYCRIDKRVAGLVQHVKQWAQSFDLMGNSDGHLTSYGYSLMTIFFLMYTKPPVVPNLQDMADGEPVRIRDGRKGADRWWNCSFWREVELLPRTLNVASLGTLLLDFFRFYLGLAWLRSAVSIRLALRRNAEEDGKVQPMLPAKAACAQAMKEQRSKDQWIIEDPFDLGHNLAAQCTSAGKGRILEAMEQVHKAMARVPEAERLQAFEECCPSAAAEIPRFMKCRVDPRKVPADEFLAAFRAFPVALIHFPVAPMHSARAGQSDVNREVFLEFKTEGDRRRTHTLNETYIGSQLLRLFYVTGYALEDARSAGATFRRLQGSGSRSPPAEPNSPDEEVGLQRERVREGIRRAEGRDELEVLVRRAAALDLTEEAAEARKRMQRETRAGAAVKTTPPPPATEADVNFMQFQ